MKYIEFSQKFKNQGVFSLSDIYLVAPKFYRSRLTEWIKKGYIQKLKNGYYMFTDISVTDHVLYFISNVVYDPSYISLEMALSCYGFIPESVYGVTAVTSRKTNTIESPVAMLIYHHIKPTLMMGYCVVNSVRYPYKIACPEKAILDYFYLNAHIEAVADFDEMRFNCYEINQQVNWDYFNVLLAYFESQRLCQRLTLFKEYIDHVNTE